MLGLSVSVFSVLLGALTFLVCIWFVRRPCNLPPGPWSLPIIGYRFKPGLIHETFMEMAEKYGPIFSLRRGPFFVVVLNDISAIKQALVKSAESLPGRYVPGHIKWTIPESNNNASVVWSSGKPWEDQRRFSLHALRSFGFGKKSLVPQINLEARYLAEEIKSLRGKPTDLMSTLNKATANVISQLVFGRRYEYDDMEYIEALQAMVDVFASIPETDPVVVLKFLIHTPWYKKYRDSCSRSKKFIMSQLYMHKDTFQKENIRDYVDAFLADDISKEYTLEEFWRIAFDFFAAGSETTSLVTSWAILYLASHPEVQRKVQMELDRVVGRGRQPTTEDRQDLPYCDATLMEVMRIRPVLAVIRRLASADVTTKGFFIPKGAVVMSNVWAVHHCPKTWSKPHLFNPDRFLSADGRKVEKSESWLPFGIGRRECLGIQLARMETFLFFTNLFQQFEFKLPSNEPPPSLRGQPGLTIPPQPYRICAIER
nr:cytochrome P450 2J4-like [Lytechinus pictus]